MTSNWSALGFATLVAWYAAAFIVSATFVPVARRLAVAHGYVAAPRQDRWHRRPTALLGGVAIVLTVLLLAVVAGHVSRIALQLAGGAFIFAVGLTDDLISLKPSTKLVAEIALASFFVLQGARLQWASVTGLDLLLTLVWLVGVTNAFNLLDNMDGLCAGVTLIAAAALLAGLAGRPDTWIEARYLTIVLGAISGFLIYNMHPASIFMGDAGSLFLGFTLAALTLTIGGPAHDRTRVLSIVSAPVLVLLIPIFDTTLVTVSRLLSGRPVSRGGRDHSSHRLVAIGLPEPSAVRVLWALAAAAGAVGIIARKFADQDVWLLSAVFLLAMVLFAVYLAHVRVYADGEAEPPKGATIVLLTFMYKRRVAEVLLDVVLVTIAYYAAWRLRFEGPEWNGYVPSLLQSLPLAIALQMVCLFVFGAYRGAWRYFGLMDGVTFGKAVAAGTASLIVAVVYLYRFELYSRGVFVIYGALLLLLLCGSRASFRLIAEFAHRRRDGLRLVIYGAFDAGALLLRELLKDPHEQYRMIGFIDDDPQTHNLRLQGYPVLGGERRLIDMVESSSIDVVVIGCAPLPAESLARLAAVCREKDVRVLQFSFRLDPLVSPA